MSEARKRGDGKEEILRVATEEFAHKGYRGTTTAQIARRAGVTQPLIHHHFGSKRALWKVVIHNLYTEVQAVIADTAVTFAASDLETRLKAILRAYVLFTARRPELARIMIVESFAGDESCDYLSETYALPLLKTVRAVMDAALEEGLFIPDIDLDHLTSIVIGASSHVFVTSELTRRMSGVNPHTPEMAERHADLVTEVIFNGVLRR